jgi:copper transport protein
VRRLLAGSVLVVLAVLGLAGRADAHASLVGAQPTPGSVVATSPSVLTLTFSEPVGIPDHALRLLDSRKQDVSIGRPSHGAGASILTATVPALAPGGYALVWRAISADGHPVSGVVTFSVGTQFVPVDVLGVGAPATADSAVVAFGTARAVGFAAALLLVGIAAFPLLVRRASAESPAVARLLAATSVVGALSALAGFALFAVDLTAGGLGDVLSSSAWSDAAATWTGRFWLLRIVLWIAVAALAAAGGARRPVTLAIVAAAVLVVVAGAGHVPGGRWRAVAWATDLTHLAAAGVWLGGLTVLAVDVLRRRAADAVAAGARFSRVALSCVVLLVVTGVVQAWRQGLDVGSLTDTTYGTTLFAKTVLVAAIVAIAAVSRTVIRRLAEGRVELADVLPRPVELHRVLSVAVVAELVVAGGVLGLTAALVREPPPDAVATAGATGRNLSTERVLEGGLIATIDVLPARVGATELHLTFTDPTTLVPKLSDANAEFSNPELGAPLSVKLVAVTPAHYISEGLQLPFTGRWTLRVSVVRNGFDELTTSVPVDVGR